MDQFVQRAQKAVSKGICFVLGPGLARESGWLFWKRLSKGSPFLPLFGEAERRLAELPMALKLMAHDLFYVFY